MQTITLTRADGGRTVELRTGDLLVIRLEENPTTGYRWELEPGGEVLALQSSEHVSPGSRIGGGGERVLTFKAVAAGTQAVRLQLRRAWEDGPARATFAVTLQVHA